MLSRRPGSIVSSNPWPLVLCLVGVDYFSTLAYLPSIAAEAAGPWAPIAAGGVVLVTFLLALPVYWYIVGRSHDGRGAAGLLEDRMPGWRGKLVVLTLLGFAAADFVITRSLSLADATIHLLHNPHGAQLLTHWPERFFAHEQPLWPPLEKTLALLGDPQVAITLLLSIVSFGLWQMLKRGVSRRILHVTAAAVSSYLILTAVILISAAFYIARHPHLYETWLTATIAPRAPDGTPTSGGSAWAIIKIILWSFPQMALGLSGFEMIMNVVPRVSGGSGDAAAITAGRIRNTRKLMLTAAALMAIYLVSAVAATTILVPAHEMTGGVATHRALAYLAHGSPLANGAGGAAINPLFGEIFGDLFDLSSAFILCLAGVSVTFGLQSLLPHYLNRLGMDGQWAGQAGVIMHVLNVIILLVTVVFRASPSLQQWAYATSVLVLLTGAAIAALKDIRARRREFLPLPPGEGRGEGAPRSTPNPALPHSPLPLPPSPFVFLPALAAFFFLSMTILTVWINRSGLVIALAFVASIVVSSFISRWIRCTELRFEGFEFANDESHNQWKRLREVGGQIVVPHRPGLITLAEKCEALQRDYRVDSVASVVFVEVLLGDPSNFYQKPLMRIEHDADLRVIRLSRCVSVAHVLAALCLEMSAPGKRPPEIIFGWSHEAPFAANLNFLLLGEGNVPWMVKELVRRAVPDIEHQPRVRIG